MVVPRTAKHVSVDNAIKDGTVSNIDIVNGTVGFDKVKINELLIMGTDGQTEVSFIDGDAINGVWGIPYINADTTTATQGIKSSHFNATTGAFKIVFTEALDGTINVVVPVLLAS